MAAVIDASQPIQNGNTTFPNQNERPEENPQSALSKTDGYSTTDDSADHAEESPGAIKTLDDATDEGRLCAALGILPIRQGALTTQNVSGDYWASQDADAESGIEGVSKYYNLVPNPDADEVDLSVLRGTRNPTISVKEQMENVNNEEGSDDLTALGELLPTLVDESHKKINANYGYDKEPSESENTKELVQTSRKNGGGKESNDPVRGKMAIKSPGVNMRDSMYVHRGDDDKTGKDEVDKTTALKALNETTETKNDPDLLSKSSDSSVTAMKHEGVTNDDKNGLSNNKSRKSSFDEQDVSGFDDVKSPTMKRKAKPEPTRRPVTNRDVSTRSGMARYSSVASISSATVSTHEVRMPMYLPTFKPATGCTNASDFIVRCFVARLRSGITVVKHGRSRWCKSRLRLLHVHQDGRSLSWKPALGEPTSSKRPPKLDLSTCMEVRHAWSPDPLYPMFTGTPILRQKCEAANAHKSFALIFPKRTVDVTAVTADQCKVLMEGFSALCFRLQVANLAGRGKGKEKEDGNKSDAENSTKSNTLTNNSGGGDSPTDSSGIKRSSYR